MYQQQLDTLTAQLKKALSHLEYSFEKVQTLQPPGYESNDELLETWESFAARFARVADIFLARYIRTRVLIGDPGFRGTLRDFLNQAEKMELIRNSLDWLEIRELRNVLAHEYTESNIKELYLKLKELCPKLLTIKELLCD